MKAATLLVLLPLLALAASDPSSTAKEDKRLTDAGYTPKDIELMRKALDQTPAEDRSILLAKVIRVGILSAILAGPAFAASLLPLALVPLILIAKHKIPPVNVIPLPPPAPYDYSPPDYAPPAPAYSPSQQYDSYSPPQPAYSPPAYSPPAYSPPQQYDSYSPPQPAYRK